MAKSHSKLNLPSRKTAALVIALALALLLLAAPSLAQAGDRVLAAGASVSGALAPDAGAATYVFDATPNSTASLALASDGGALALMLSDMNGNSLGQALDTAGAGALTLTDVALASGGRYLVFVFFAPGSPAQETAFSLTLALTDAASAAAESAAPESPAEEPALVLLGAGIEVNLRWNDAVDLNLEVRDPTGQSLHWNSRVTDNGGSFGFDANGLCEQVLASPEETATWQPGYLATGSYEVIVYFEQDCDANPGTVGFTLEATVDGQPSAPLTGLLNPIDNKYVTRFIIRGDGSATLSPGGIYRDSDLARLPSGFSAAASGASPLQLDVPAFGAISNAQPFLTYSFIALAEDIISVDMQAVGPNLDALLQIVDPAGQVVNVNDDAGGSTNARIANARLLSSGNYTIIATRYAKEFGGTEGQFQLTLTGPTSDAPAQLSNLNLPQGDIEVSLSWNTSADLQLLVRDPGGVAIFDDNPNPATGGILGESGNVNCVPAASGAPVSYIYWPLTTWRPGTYEVEVWYQNACVELPPQVDFTLRVEVLGQPIINTIEFPLPGQRYVTNFTVQPDGFSIAGERGFIDGGSATLDYQEEAFDAQQIFHAEPVTGFISADNIFDVYRFDGSAGQSVTITMSAIQSLDTNLYLISPLGQEVAANDDADPLLNTGQETDSLISGYVLQEYGPYTVIATRFANQYGGTIGQYQLTMRRN